MAPLKDFLQIVNEEWQSVMKNNPLFATRTGDYRYNDELEKMSEDHYEKQIDEYREYLSRLDRIDTKSLAQSQKLNYDIFKQRLHKRIGILQFRLYRMPISKTSGFHSRFASMHQFVPLATKKEYEDLLSRYSQIGRYIDDQISLMKVGMETGYIPPKITMDGVTDSISSQITDNVEDSPYFVPFHSEPEFISDFESMKDRAEKIIREIIEPALDRLRQFLSDEYIPACRDDIAATSLPEGSDYYQFMIQYFTSLSLSPTEIHQIGLDEVTRINSEMDQIIEESGFEGTKQEFVEFLRTDQQFYAKTPEELMQKTALVLKEIDGKLPLLFKTLPRLPYGIREIPEYEAPYSTTAYYYPGSGDGTKAGFYYVNTYDLSSRPLYEVEALSLHEAVPGHHLQIALQMELNLPKFRQYSGNTSFVEGWGLYAERLGLEIGFYQDPHSNFGRLSYEMWRACRLVVDTGMHALGWSRQEAIEFMATHTSLSLLNIENEVDRYIAWPGQALAYKLGELKIKELRSRAEQSLDEEFDLREFHDQLLLDGALPLDILEMKISEWIDAA